MRKFGILSVLCFIAVQCKSLPEASGTKNLAQEISPPFASGQFADVSWQLRMNRGQCVHPPRPATYCTAKDDKARIAKESGIDDTLLSWINDPETQSVRFSYMTFGNSQIAEALCRRAQDPAFTVDIFLKAEFVFPPEQTGGSYKQLVDCSNGSNYNIYPRGQGWLNHAKIFMASGKNRVHMTSSSANLSGSGTSLHYDNWLMFDAPADSKLAKANHCFLDAVRATGESLSDALKRLGERRPSLLAEQKTLTQEIAGKDRTDPSLPALKEKLRAIDKELSVQQDKAKMILAQDVCMTNFAFSKEEPVQFLATPIPQRRPQAVDVLGELIDASQSTIEIAAHKITQLDSRSLPIVDKLLARMNAGVQVSIVFDDDTILRAKKIGSISGQQVSPQEVDAYLSLEKGGATIKFLDTSEADFALMHNKFMIFDRNVVFTGAGNFSKASLRGTNTEQFYVVRVPEIISAYKRGWDELSSWAFPADYYTPQSQGLEEETPPPGDPEQEEAGSGAEE